MRAGVARSHQFAGSIFGFRSRETADGNPSTGEHRGPGAIKPRFFGVRYLTNEAVVLMTAVQKLTLTKSAAPRPKTAVQFTRTSPNCFIPLKKPCISPPQKNLVVPLLLFQCLCTRRASVSAV